MITPKPVTIVTPDDADAEQVVTALLELGVKESDINVSHAKENVIDHGTTTKEIDISRVLFWSRLVCICILAAVFMLLADAILRKTGAVVCAGIAGIIFGYVFGANLGYSIANMMSTAPTLPQKKLEGPVTVIATLSNENQFTSISEFARRGGYQIA